MRLNDGSQKGSETPRVWVGELLPVKEPVLAGMRGQNSRAPVAVPGLVLKEVNNCCIGVCRN